MHRCMKGKTTTAEKLKLSRDSLQPSLSKPSNIDSPVIIQFDIDHTLTSQQTSRTSPSLMLHIILFCVLWRISYPEPVVIQLQSSGNPVCLEHRPQCTLECHWRKNFCSQCVSNGFPVAFQCVPIMQINTGSPLGHHWVLASASVVPVASQCSCGSSGLLVWSV